jgi:hypothetical protein
MAEVWSRVLRAKGWLWAGHRPELAYHLSQAGGICDLYPAGAWPEASRDEPEELTPGQRLVFIGIDLPQAQIEAILDACLLTEDEMAWTPTEWDRVDTDFPTPPAQTPGLPALGAVADAGAPGAPGAR